MGGIAPVRQSDRLVGILGQSPRARILGVSSGKERCRLCLTSRALASIRHVPRSVGLNARIVPLLLPTRNVASGISDIDPERTFGLCVRNFRFPVALMNIPSCASAAKWPGTVAEPFLCLEDRAYFFFVVVEEPVVV
jgi:hypothetical protein